MRKIFLVLLGCAIGLLVALVLMVGGLYWASQQKPTFYQQALVVPVEKQREASDQLLAQAAALTSTARREGDWEAVFTADQINGWLAVDLVENHPDLLPQEVKDPRVAFKPQEVLVGWLLEQRGVQTVCSIRATVTLAEPNVLAVRLREAHAGSIPLPLGMILDVVRDRAAEAKIQLEWKQTEGDPVALVTLPATDEEGQLRRLDKLEVQDGKVYISGGVESASQAAARRDRRAAMRDEPPGDATAGEDASDDAGPSGTPAEPTSRKSARRAADDARIVASSQSVGSASAAKARRGRSGTAGSIYRAF